MAKTANWLRSARLEYRDWRVSYIGELAVGRERVLVRAEHEQAVGGRGNDPLRRDGCNHGVAEVAGERVSWWQE